MWVCIFVNVKELHNLYTACTILILFKSHKVFKTIVHLVWLGLWLVICVAVPQRETIWPYAPSVHRSPRNNQNLNFLHSCIPKEVQDSTKKKKKEGVGNRVERERSKKCISIFLFFSECNWVFFSNQYRNERSLLSFDELKESGNFLGCLLPKTSELVTIVKI